MAKNKKDEGVNLVAEMAEKLHTPPEIVLQHLLDRIFICELKPEDDQNDRRKAVEKRASKLTKKLDQITKPYVYERMAEDEAK